MLAPTLPGAMLQSDGENVYLEVKEEQPTSYLEILNTIHIQSFINHTSLIARFHRTCTDLIYISVMVPILLLLLCLTE